MEVAKLENEQPGEWMRVVEATVEEWTRMFLGRWGGHLRPKPEHDGPGYKAFFWYGGSYDPATYLFREPIAA